MADTDKFQQDAYAHNQIQNICYRILFCAISINLISYPAAIEIILRVWAAFEDGRKRVYFHHMIVTKNTLHVAILSDCFLDIKSKQDPPSDWIVLIRVVDSLTVRARYE